MEKPEIHFPEKTKPDQPRRKRDRGLLTVGAVARRLNVSHSFVYTAISEGRLEALRLGKGQGCLRIARSMLRRFMADCPTTGRKEDSDEH